MAGDEIPAMLCLLPQPTVQRLASLQYHGRCVRQQHLHGGEEGPERLLDEDALAIDLGAET